jgi:hypothetical protein
MFLINLPTVDKLKSLYESKLYQNLLNEFAKRSNSELDNREQDTSVLLNKLSNCHRQYLLLDIPFEEVLSVFKNNKEQFLDYQIAATAYFTDQGRKTAKLSEVSKIDKTYLIERFCEFYLLKVGDKNRLEFYLSLSKVPHSGQYAEQITKLYEQTRQRNTV